MRVILVHVNVELEDDDPRTVDEVATAIMRGDTERMTAEIALVEEV